MYENFALLRYAESKRPEVNKVRDIEDDKRMYYAHCGPDTRVRRSSLQATVPDSRSVNPGVLRSGTTTLRHFDQRTTEKIQSVV